MTAERELLAEGCRDAAHASGVRPRQQFAADQDLRLLGAFWRALQPQGDRGIPIAQFGIGGFPPEGP